VTHPRRREVRTIDMTGLRLDLRRSAYGVAAGLAAAALGLGAAEVVAAVAGAGPRDSLNSPVLDVGDRVVDGVPNTVKELAIDWFGTNDKVALLAGIGIALACLAALIGVASLGRRASIALAGIALFGLVGVYASQSTRRDAPWTAGIPSVVAAAVAAAAIVGFRRLATVDGDTGNDPGHDTASDATAHRPSVGDLTVSTRRRFLVAAGGTAAGAVVLGASARRLQRGPDAATSRRRIVLPRAAAPLSPAPSAVAADGAAPFFTPNADFYRIDTALTVPRIAAEDWRLRIHGMVAREVELDWDALIARDVVEADITITCVSNEVGGRLVGTARWLGVRLDDLLADVGVDPTADQIVGRSSDGYTCGFPTAVLDGRDALVAIAMNGEPLPLEHGFPARLIVPGLYGYVSATKWLTEIELTRFEDFDQYWVRRGWVDDAPIRLQSRIDSPRGLASIAPGPIAVAGVAWAQTRGIERVELRIDDGGWVEATLAEELSDATWRQWSYAWDARPGRHAITVRATERGGPIQTAERSEPFPSGATGQHQIVVIVA
jgi:DMSO/TMAO reductase YedYZ molybdopterin-dependent catalytic subunit